MRDIQDSIKNAGNAVPLVNQATAVGFDYSKKNIVIDSLKGEIGYSSSDIYEQVGASPEKYMDAAWTLSAGKKIDLFETGLNFDYSEYRPRFIGGGSDTRSFNIGGNSNLSRQEITLGTRYGFSHDNLENQKQATTYSHNAALTPTFKFKDWPVLSLSESFTLQDTIGNRNLEAQTINNAVSISASQQLKYWDKNHNLSLSLSQNNSISSRPGTSSESVARSFSSSYSIADMFPWLGFDSSYSFNMSESSGSPMISFSDTSGLNFNFQISAWKLSVPLGMTVSRSWDNGTPRTTDNLSLAITMSLSYTLFERHSLGLSTGLTSYYDYINPASDYRQFTLTFSYSTQF